MGFKAKKAAVMHNRLFLVGVMFLSAVFLTANCLAGNGPLMIEDPWPPYTVGKFGEAPEGIAVEVNREIFRRIGVEPRLALYPWKRVLKMAEVGNADGIMLLMKTKERQAFLLYTDKLFSNVDRVFANTDSRKVSIQSLKDLKHYRLGYVYGFVYGDSVDNLLFRLAPKTFSAYTPEDNLGELANKRVDFIIESRHVVKSILEKKPGWTGKVHEIDLDLESYDYYMGISKKSKYAGRIREINKVISDMKKDGTMDRLAAGAKAD